MGSGAAGYDKAVRSVEESKRAKKSVGQEVRMKVYVGRQLKKKGCAFKDGS